MTAYTKKGFTLIELLIVMAILGVLAVVVLVAINPVQQLARTRDSGRKSTVTQIGHALEAYFTAHNGEYLDGTNCVDGAGASKLADSWMTCLQEAGEMSSVPSPITNSVGNNNNCDDHGAQDGLESNLCYVVDGTASSAAIYTVLESQSEESKCPNQVPFFIWSTEDGRGGTVCLDTNNIPSEGVSYVGSYEED